MHRVTASVALVGALWAGAIPAQGTVFRAVRVEVMAARADAVVVARRASGLDSRAEMRGGRIVTTLSLEVSRVVTAGPRGRDLAGSVAVTLPGGTVVGPHGPLAQQLAGTPDFAPGAWQVVFLHRLADGRWTVLNLALGVYPLAHHADGTVHVMPPPLRDATLVDAQGQPASVEALGLGPEGLPWSVFVQRIAGARP